MKKILTISIIAAFVFISCSKEKTELVSKTELLTASPWYHMRTTRQVGSIITESIYSFTDICRKDDSYNFKSAGKLIVTEGATKCLSGDPEIRHSWTWKLKDNETILALNPGFGDVDWQIAKLTKDSLVIYEKEANGQRIITNYFAHAF